MKKTMMLLLVLLVAAAMAACKSEPAKPTVPAATVEAQPQQTDSTEPPVTEHLVGDPEETEPQNVQEEQSVLEPFTMTFDAPVTLVETDDMTITASGVGMDDDEYLVVDTLMTNSNPDMTYEVSVLRAAVNGIEIYPAFTEDVENEYDEPIAIDLSNVLEYAKISKITDVELTIHIENDDWETVFEDTVHIYPYGKDKAVKFVRTPADTDLVLADDSRLAVTVLGCEYIEDWGYSVHLYVENKTGAPIRLEAEYFRMNDVAVSTWYDDVVGAGDVCFSHVEWSQGDLDDAEITEVNSVGFVLRVYNQETDQRLLDKEVELNP